MIDIIAIQIALFSKCGTIAEIQDLVLKNANPLNKPTIKAFIRSPKPIELSTQ